MKKININADEVVCIYEAAEFNRNKNLKINIQPETVPLTVIS